MQHSTDGVDKSLRLRVENLACDRGYRRLFSGVKFNLHSGEGLQLAGANGAGKSTLLKTLCGLRRPQKGRVYWVDANVHEHINAYDNHLLYIGHDNALNLDLTPLENLGLLCRLAGIPAPDTRAALAAVGLSNTANRPCRSLSAGQRRRVALARLEVCRAPLWMLDEPAAALDAAAREYLGERIAQHLHEGGMAIFTTHEPLPLGSVSTQTLCLDA